MFSIRKLLLVFCVTILMTSSAPPQNEYGKLLEKLSSVARVTNAIALHSYAIRKKLNMHTMFAELMRIPNATLNELRALDSPKMKTTLTWISEQARDSKSILSQDKISEIKESMQVFYDATRLAEFVKQTENFSVTPQELQTDLQNLNVTGLQFCGNAIEMTDFELVREIIWTSVRVSAPEKDKALQRFNASRFKVMNCLNENNGSYEAELKNMYMTFLKTQPFRNMKNAASWYHTSFLNFSTLYTAFEANMAVAKGLESFWSAETLPRWTGSQKALQTAYDVFVAKKDVNTTAFTLTSGFHNLEDFGKIYDDLRSKWFLKHIAGNRLSDARQLQRALASFQKFSKSVSKMTDTLKVVFSHLIALGGESELDRMIKHFGKVSEFAVFLEEENFNVTSNFEQVRDGLKNCWSKSIVSNSTEMYMKYIFLEKVTQFDWVMDKLKLSQHHLEMIAQHYTTTRSDQEGQRQFEEFVGEMNALFAKNNYMQNMVDFQHLRKKSENYAGFERIIFTILKIGKSEKSLQDAFPTALPTDFVNIIDLRQFWNETNGMEVASCTQTLEPLSNFWIQVNQFFKLVTETPEVDSLVETAKLLENFGEIQRHIDELQHTMEVELKKRQPLLSNFANPMESSQRFAKGLGALNALNKVRINEQFLLDATSTSMFQKLDNAFASNNNSIQASSFREKWLTVGTQKAIKRLLQDLTALDKIAVKVHDDAKEMQVLFSAASKIRGLPMTPRMFKRAARQLDNSSAEAKHLERMANLDLTFATFTGTLVGAITSYDSVLLGYDVMYRSGQSDYELSPIVIIVLSVGGVIIIIGIAIGLIGYTKRGRRIYFSWYFYYFGKSKDFEKRWRYSYFMDHVDDENIIDAAIRLSNTDKLKTVLNNGAYVDAYNRWGNTALHTCVRSLQSSVKSELVEMARILIEHGADRTLLNFENKTAEQSIPHQKSEQSRLMAEMFNKYREKRFRLYVPQEFTSASFQIYCEEHLDDALTEKFMEKFKSITSDEPLPSTTHVILKTDKEGCLATNDFELIAWVFRGMIIVREDWMADCVRSKRRIEHDTDYLVESVRYRGKLYPNAILTWSEAIAKSKMPFLLGVHVVVLFQDCKFYTALEKVVAKLGGIVMREVPPRETFNRGAHPYLHANLNPVWILHDESFDLLPYQNDRDWLFSFFTEQEFVTLMLERKTVRNTAKHPIPIVSD